MSGPQEEKKVCLQGTENRKQAVQIFFCYKNSFFDIVLFIIHNVKLTFLKNVRPYWLHGRCKNFMSKILLQKNDIGLV